MDSKLEMLNSTFSGDEIQITKSFEETDTGFEGQILLLSNPKPDLRFKVFVPNSFPFTEREIAIRFFSNQVAGYPHVNDDNSLCIKSLKCPDFHQRLRFEIQRLKEWRDKYYIREEQDDLYEYLITPYDDAACFLFTDLKKDFKRGEFGDFNGYLFSGKPKGEELCFIKEIGGRKCDWGNYLMNQKVNIDGIFVFIDEEPIIQRRSICKTWQDLQPYLSQDFLNGLYSLKKNIKKKSKKPQTIPILLGYSIPNSNEIHWQMAKMDARNVPIKGEKIGPKKYQPVLTQVPIKWSKTVNASYSRFFGRGKVCNRFADAKNLIIGTGAVGSSLAKILARSGIKHLDLSDIDIVEPGNICRSEFDLFDINFSKHSSIQIDLQLISPHISTSIVDSISKELSESKIDETRSFLEQYDFIFDCTSDIELSYIIDKLEVNSTVINLTISNKAREMVCVVGGNNITKVKDHFFNSLDSREPNLIYEGLGCWHPTFEASYFDINALLNLAVKNLDYQIHKKGAPNSFIIRTEFNNSSINLKTVDY